MYKKLFLSLSITGAILTNTSIAETIARPSAVDSRTRSVAYHEMQVYLIVGYYGYFTRIEFAPDETDVQFALGDEEAWTVVATGNNLLVKPSKPQPDTNMAVLTNKRAYNFVLSGEPSKAVRPEGREETSPTAPRRDQQFLIKFTYPQEEAKKAAEEREAKRKAYAEQKMKEEKAIKESIDKYQLQASLNSASNTTHNTNYLGCGAKEVLPEAIYDNRQFTYMKFPAGADIPSFYVTNKFGEESLVNYNVEKDWVVIQRTFNDLTLRNGKYVGCIINTNRHTERTTSGTISPTVERILIEDAE